MYSARIVNAHLDRALDHKTPHLSTLLPARESTLPRMSGVLTSRDSGFQLEDREAWVFISIKNRSFNRAYINRFIDMCDLCGLQGHVCPVDDPYRYNAMAELGLDVLPDAEAAKIERLSADIARMVKKAINGKRSERVDIVAWRSLESATPAKYREELTHAFKSGGQIRNILYDHVSSVKTIETERDFERYAEFFLCETPVLLHTYYGNGAAMDIYPGSQPRFFWQIELGVFADELPGLTALTQQSPALLYLDTHDRSGTPR